MMGEAAQQADEADGRLRRPQLVGRPLGFDRQASYVKAGIPDPSMLGGQMTEAATFVAVFACTLFTGAAIYINLVEHPARLACGTELAATQWVPSYERATVMQVSLAVLAAASGTVRWTQGGGVLWLWGAIVIFAVIPFTVVVILPTNKKLLDPNRNRGSDETRALLETWGRLHAVRTVLGLLASSLFIWLAATRS